MAKIDTQFKTGHPGYKKKGSVCGRKQALAALDYVAGQESTQKKLKKAFQDKLSHSPMAFFTELIMPLLPKESALELSGDTVIKAVVSESGKIETKRIIPESLPENTESL